MTKEWVFEKDSLLGNPAGSIFKSVSVKPAVSVKPTSILKSQNSLSQNVSSRNALSPNFSTRDVLTQDVSQKKRNVSFGNDVSVSSQQDQKIQNNVEQNNSYQNSSNEYYETGSNRCFLDYATGPIGPTYDEIIYKNWKMTWQSEFDKLRELNNQNYQLTQDQLRLSEQQSKLFAEFNSKLSINPMLPSLYSNNEPENVNQSKLFKQTNNSNLNQLHLSDQSRLLSQINPNLLANLFGNEDGNLPQEINLKLIQVRASTGSNEPFPLKSNSDFNHLNSTLNQHFQNLLCLTDQQLRLLTTLHPKFNPNLFLNSFMDENGKLPKEIVSKLINQETPSTSELKSSTLNTTILNSNNSNSIILNSNNSNSTILNSNSNLVVDESKTTSIREKEKNLQTKDENTKCKQDIKENVKENVIVENVIVSHDDNDLYQESEIELEPNKENKENKNNGNDLLREIKTKHLKTYFDAVYLIPRHTFHVLCIKERIPIEFFPDSPSKSKHKTTILKSEAKQLVAYFRKIKPKFWNIDSLLELYK